MSGFGKKIVFFSLFPPSDFLNFRISNLIIDKEVNYFFFPIFSFLQDAGQVQLRLPTDISNHQKLTHLAQLYSLKMEADDGITVLTKTR